MTGLPAKFRAETTHLGYPAQEIAAVTCTTRALIAQKRHPVINDPVGEVLPGCIESRSFAVGAAARPYHAY
jgi:hypothetical protein